MTHSPRDRDSIYESLRSSLLGRISRLTNFTERSFNYVWTQAFSREVRELEVQTLASELNGWVEYAGGPITQQDLNDLGIGDAVSPDEVNEFIDEQALDELVKIVGVRRFEGALATGTVTITTQSEQTTIPFGTELTTDLTEDGDAISFETAENAETASGVTQVTDVDIIALDTGAEYNVPANSITRFSDPPVGVRGVTNPAATTGGESRESNEELRSRAKQAVQASSEGGTTDGIKGYIRKNIDGVGQGDVLIDEFTDTSPPFVDVIVDGGIENEVLDAIDFSRPTGIRHNLVRPQAVQLGFDTYLLGDSLTQDILDQGVEGATAYLLELGINENVYRDQLIQLIMESNANIINVDNLGGFIERVTNESFVYDSTQSDYRLDYTYEKTNGSISLQDETGDSYTENTDFEVQDQTGDGHPETIVWLNNSEPTDGDTFSVDYDVTVPGTTAFTDYYDLSLIRDEPFVWNPSYNDQEDYESTQDIYKLDFVPFPTSLTVSDNSGDMYTEGIDFDLIDDTGNGFKQSIDWSIGGSSPDDNELFTATYDQKLYQTVYDIIELPTDTITDESGDTYTESTDFDIVSYEQNNAEFDAIEWTNNPTSITDGEEFYLTYINQGDRFFGKREKAAPGTITASSVR